MNSKSLRRLATDHASLHTAGLPPNYLFPPSNSSHDPSADLTNLDVLLAGPPGTPFASGLFALHLSIPPTYPVHPPTATFRTRIFHPNVDEATGAVCVETLKRDWSEKLRLRDVLVTISCLLIQPNPESALNAEAGRLCAEDWGSFERRVKVWVGIHAGVPKALAAAVEEARERGEDKKVQGKTEGQLEDSTAQRGGEIGGISKGKGKGKEREVMETPKPRKNKVVQDVGLEEEENRARREATVEQESDPESDWIPGPVKAIVPFGSGRDNILGIRTGSGDSMDVDEAIDVAQSSPSTSGQIHDSLMNGSIIRPPPSQIGGPSHPHAATTAALKQKLQPTNTSLKFAHSNPFTPIQVQRPSSLLTDFSISWADSEILHETGSIEDAPTKAEVLKRLRGPEEVERVLWERKKFKASGGSLSAYNRGVWGARVGLKRL